MPRHSRAGADDAAVRRDRSGSAAAGGRSPKRRKIRKGTHSCWACKRKKIRCTFSTPDGEPIDLDTLDNPSEALVDVVCDGCRRRGTPCVSQELPETAALSAAANHSRQVDDRLGRMEALVEMLIKNATRGDTGASSGAGTASPRSERSRSGAVATRPRDAERELPDFSTIVTNCCTPVNPLRPGDGEDDDDDAADLGPDNLQQNSDSAGLASHHAPRSTTSAVHEGYIAVHQAGISPREPSDQQPTTYTTWFGHERGIGEEEQPGTLPPPTTAGPTTPASTASMRCVGAATNSRAGSASTACTEPSPADNLNTAGNASDGPARNAPYLSATRMHQEYMNRYDALAATWPTPGDLETILEALERPVRSGLHKVLVFTPLSAVTAAESPPISRESARSLLKLPPVGAHLVLVAQKLLYLASFLQHMHPMFDPDLKRLSMPHRELIQRIMCVTTTIVMGNDSLIGSFEGVQCLVMQGIIQSNQGNLRRAWLAFRRALTMTQLMGLHRGFPAATVTMLDPTVSPLTMPKCMWFRILYADRYLSLMLGLPQGLPGDSHVLCPDIKRKGVESLKPNPPSELNGYGHGTSFGFSEAWNDLRKIEEAHAVITGRIIERNEAWRSEEEDKMMDGSNAWDIDFSGGFESNSDIRNNMDDDLSNPISTQSIDMALQRASRSMPAQWWLTPSISETSASEGDGATNFVRTQQLIDQLFHYHLLTQLHLPYMLRRGSDCQKPYHLARGDGECTMTSTEPEDKRLSGLSGSAGSVDKYAYSKITCVSASREVLSRFLSLRSNKQVTFFCRCMDFFALLASMTLCLAHLDSHRNEQMLLQKQPKKDRSYMGGNDFLAHQRLSDRGMMERVLQSMDEMTKINEDDALSAKSGAFLRRMLDVEHDASLAVAALVGCPDAKLEIEQREASAHTKGTDGDLRVWVPFLGTIRINKEGILRVKGNECSLKLPTEANDPEHQSEQTVQADGGGPTTTNKANNSTGQILTAAPEPQSADAPSFDASTVPTSNAAIQGNNATATATSAYPAMASGASATLNSLSGIGLPVPAWSSSDAYIPNNNPDVNLLMHGALGNGSASGVGAGGTTAQPETTPENTAVHHAIATTSTSGNTDGKIAIDADGPIPEQPSDAGGPEDAAILTNSRRPGKLGENMLWI
ncbi:c6 zinc finger domain-containing protein [Ophiostoma piceae UAMH 11346]|uniref:C6 zinc finger domain-containing protein n=1 Tax=Ophiostoma piceae (strain UAMH 11346) TaxID=1262450 RepID=S3BNT4_OPHP1|nr:c6 zinc finger domain-containing protein [Ophiostoma piceae UAMH 11346]